MPGTAVLKPSGRPAHAGQRIKALVLYAVDESRRTLSYQQGWPTAFAADRRFDTTLANLASRRGRLAAEAALRLRRFDAIVVLHSVLSNEPVFNERVVEALARHSATKAYFIGNEYKLMQPKMEFCERIGVSLLVSMMTNEEILELYRERLHCHVTTIPSAGLDTTIFHPTTDLRDRPIDLGMRAYPEPWYVGHGDRESIARFFTENAEALGLVVDVSVSDSGEKRFTPPEYAAFLNRCRGQLGTEAGSDQFDFYDDTHDRATRAMLALPEPPVDKPAFYAAFYARHGTYPSGRTISGRHAEAAGTRTLQILFRGEYSGLFEPDIHYLCLEKDFSNVDDVIARFRDDDVCREVAENAYRVAKDELTYERLIDRFVDALKPHLPTHPVR